jgi:hypothetical protein
MTSSVQQTNGDTAWTPPATMKLHSGRPLEPKLVFFSPPPEEIGEVTSGYSSLKKGQTFLNRITAIPSDVWQGGLLFAVIAGFVPGILINFIPGATPFAVIVGFLAAFGVLGFFIYAATFPRCSYVGSKGVATFTLAKGKADAETFLFEKASELRSEETRKYKNNIYQGTSYTYTWTDGAGKSVHAISGMYVSEKSTPSDKNDYTLALSAERAWTSFLFEGAKKELEQRGSLTFKAKNADALTLGDGFIEINRRGEVVRLNRDDMPMLVVEQGVVTVSSKNTTFNFFGSTGAYTFNYHDIANASLFLVLFDALIAKS